MADTRHGPAPKAAQSRNGGLSAVFHKCKAEKLIRIEKFVRLGRILLPQRNSRWRRVRYLYFAPETRTRARMSICDAGSPTIVQFSCGQG